MPEVNYKVQFAQKYFNIELCQFDVLNEVDVLLLNRRGNHILYIESKTSINETEKRKALAQVILTNKKQRHILSTVALIYQDPTDGSDCFLLIDCSDNSIMYNNDINWTAERPSNPSRDAIERINDRLIGKTTLYKNGEIKEIYKKLLKGKTTKIDITLKNLNLVYNDWKNMISFTRPINEHDEQLFINLFLVDLLNGTKYRQRVLNGTLEGVEIDLIREGTNLNLYEIIPHMPPSGNRSIKYNGETIVLYEIANQTQYDDFWKKYNRPPEKDEFLAILERSGTLYSEQYRKDTGGEYTPLCLVELQNKLLNDNLYDMSEYLVFDPCCGVGNLQNQFGLDYKKNCFMSTLEQTDVDICKIKGFENVVQFNYLKDGKNPTWLYRGNQLGIKEICERERKKLMVIMNPPYHNTPGFKNDIAIEFFNKVVKLNPDTIVYYCKTEFLLRKEIEEFIKSGYKIVSHITTNGKTTFKISELGISMIIFDKDRGVELTRDNIDVDRFEYNSKEDKMEFVRHYKYNTLRPSLLTEIEKKIRDNMTGQVIGQWCYLAQVLVVSNGGKEKKSKITTNNIKYCLLSKGICFNSHAKYFERNLYALRGTYEEIPEELINDSIMFSLFYINNNFSNKSVKNYIMPFTSNELGCGENELNVLLSNRISLLDDETEDFDFRQWFHSFNYSEEAKALYQSALNIVRWYHHGNNSFPNKNFNDSFYDITNAIMGKDETSFKEIAKEDDTRTLLRTKTTEGTIGFGRRNINKVISDNTVVDMFVKFFDNRDILARKIDRKLRECGLLLWERDNIF